ncbi:hypothetical protein IMF23_04945 [Chelatococcus daeguensis]|uniref:hypothetical protein n=1 Tax=Chelatococcus daeguensis TaxID=444444 RepID=UPI0007AB3064|nr:hypothetical protein [Chelatococcus daeguensis]KZE33710.1 hypothetical protein AVW15_17840 [Chelatococcus daeguensis]MBM3082783.1 hypothetical protein [Chelatococcus daeguensis]
MAANKDTHRGSQPDSAGCNLAHEAACVPARILEMTGMSPGEVAESRRALAALREKLHVGLPDRG